jgi:general secretion pathway protein I
MKSGQIQNGMTLIEVLVALVVIGLALAAVIKTVDSGVVGVAYMKERSFAHWVAANHETQMQLDGVSVGSKSQEVSMAQRDWHVRTRVEATNDPAILRAYIDVFVSRDSEEPSAQLVTYIGKSS